MSLRDLRVGGELRWRTRFTSVSSEVVGVAGVDRATGSRRESDAKQALGVVFTDAAGGSAYLNTLNVLPPEQKAAVLFELPVNSL